VAAALKEMDQPKRNELNSPEADDGQAYVAPFPTLSKYQVWQPWLLEFYTSLSSSPSLFNSNAWWVEVVKIPADRRGWQ